MRRPYRPEPEAKMVIGYCRVSTDRQADKGVSLDAQSQKISAMAVVQGVEVAEIITDAGESAKSLDRPGMARLLDMVDNGKVRAVIIAKLDRLTRSVKDLAELLERFERKRVALVSVAESLDTASASGRLVINIMCAVSQWEREAIGERTATALRFKRSSKKVYNHVPFGYERQGDQLVPLPAEQQVILTIQRLRQEGRSLHQIAAELNVRGVSTKHGSQWHARTVKFILDNPLHQAAA